MKKCIIILALATSTSAVKAGLIHHWDFDQGSGGTATDIAGSENGTINGATWATGTGNRASYLSFDGNDDSVDPSLLLPQWSGSNAETWTVWIKDAGGNNNDIVVGNRQDAASPYPNGSNRLFTKLTLRGATSGRFVFNDGDATTMDFNAMTPGYTGNFPDDEWVHFAAVRDGADFTFYINGNLVNNTPVTIPAGDMPTSVMPFFMGGEPGAAATEHFAGGLDDVRIYNHALSASEVTALVIPEPATLALFAVCGGGLLFLRRRFT